MYDCPLSSRDILKYFLKPSEFVKQELGLQLFPKQAEIIDKYYERDENGIDKYKYLTLMCGMRAGKSTIIASMMLYQIFRFIILDDISEFLLDKLGRVVENMGFTCIAMAAGSREQAKDTLFSKVQYLVTKSQIEGKFFSYYKSNIKSQEVEFEKNLNIWVGPGTTRSSVGRTVMFAALDEVAQWKDSGFGPDTFEGVFSYIQGSTSTFGTFGKLAILSSPDHPGDPVVRTYSKIKSGELKPGIAFHYSTWELNPSFTKEQLMEEADSEEAFRLKFAADPYAVVTTSKRTKLFKGNITLDHEMYNVLESDIYSDDKLRVLGLDPAIKSDTFGIAIGYYDWNNDQIVVDGIKELKPGDVGGELDAREVLSYIVDNICNRFNVTRFGVDTHMYIELEQTLESMGLIKDFKWLTRQHYENFKFDLESQKVKVVYHPTLYKELKDIEIINDRRVDHPRNSSKDISDAVVQVHRLLRTENPTTNTFIQPIVLSFNR